MIEIKHVTDYTRSTDRVHSFVAMRPHDEVANPIGSLRPQAR
jgi:hypothetical protein